MKEGVKKSTSKTKLTDAERHERFVAMAREVGVDESPEAFDRAFKRVVQSVTPAESRARRTGRKASS